MAEPDQCIICLEPLPHPQSQLPTTTVDGQDVSLSAPTTLTIRTAATAANATVTPTTTTNTITTTETAPNITTALLLIPPTVNTEENTEQNHLNIVAALDGCEHMIHDACIRSWALKTNSCPICRTQFHNVRVFNGVDGTAISQYQVEDKKQVAEFDFQQWVGENIEEEEEDSHPCPICNTAEREDILLLCDACNAAYHTHCLGLEGVPEGDWYCIECRDRYDLPDEPEHVSFEGENRPARSQRRPQARGGRGYHVRTRARLRRARQQQRNFEWQGAWGQFAGRFFDLSDVDLDNADEEDEELEQFRRFQQLDRRELQRWQQRMNIANRLGARETFVNNIPPQISEHLQPPPPVETRDERLAWGALDRARDTEESANRNSRKRKTRSITASPTEPAQEPERKLKRPRTRRLPLAVNGEASASAISSAAVGPSSGRTAHGSNSASSHPPLVSSLLKELEPCAGSDDEIHVASWRAGPAASSPAMSPAQSPHSSPRLRALSMTPPPFPGAGGRPTSPTLSLSTHIEPKYMPANYSPNRKGVDSNDLESRSSRPENVRPEIRPLELRQPRPRRPNEHRIPDSSPTRETMTREDKENINAIVKTALRPHWRAQKLTSDQYVMINRDISRKLYEEVRDATSLDEDTRRAWEKKVSAEVAQAVAGLQA